MTPTALATLYAVTGIAVVVLVLRTHPGGTRPNALVLVVTWICWPLVAPVLLGKARATTAPAEVSRTTCQTIRAALDEAASAAETTPLAALLSRKTAEDLGAEVERATRRHGELVALLRDPGFDLPRARQRVSELERVGGSERVLATARIHLHNVEELDRMRAADAHAIEELRELATALRTQIVLARYAGSSIDGASGIVTEMWARVEGLGAALSETES